MPKTYAPPIGSQLKVIAETLHRADGFANAREEVPGQTCEFKFGYQAAVSNSEISIWDVAAVYVYPATAKVMTVSSDDPADDAAGTGARTVTSFGLDANYAEISEQITLVSTTAVSTVNSYLRVHRMQVNSAGSGGQNVGIIYTGASTVTAGVPDEKYAAISPTENQTLMALFTVPAGKTAYLKSVTGSVGASAADLGATIRFKVRPFGEVFQTKDKYNTVRQQVALPHDPPQVITEKSDIQCTAIRTGSTDVAVSATFELILRDN